MNLLALEKQLSEKVAAEGVLYHLMRRVDHAVTLYKLALQGDPDNAGYLTNCALALHQLHRFEEAKKFHDRAVANATSDQMADIRFNRSVTLLVTGEMKRGFEDLEWMWRLPRSNARAFKNPAWRGEPIKGKTILVHCDQGYGDTIQFCRYAYKLATAGAEVILVAPMPLVDLLCSMPGDEVGVMVRGEEPEHHDLECRLMDLPRLCGTTLDTIPNGVPYLFAEKPWKFPLPADGKPRVGLVWAGLPAVDDHANDLMRKDKTFPCETYAPLLELDCHFFSLQKGMVPTIPIVDMMQHVESFADTAALVAELDLVISADAAVAHLAGAMGKPVWLINPYYTAWRWLIDKEDSPWYPTIKIFRQQFDLDWCPVIERVKDELRSFVPVNLKSRKGRFHGS